MINESDLKKFKYKGLKIFVHPQVYDPAEDTFLLLDSLDISSNNKIFEIGTGCGIISIYCCMKGANVLCSDINPYAVRLTKYNIEKNKSKLKGEIEVRKGNLFDVLSTDEFFDIIIFNPPYLPSKKDDLTGDKWFDKAVDGGINGLKYTIFFIDNVSSFLRANGYCFLVFSSLSDGEKLEKKICDNNFKSEIVNSIIFNDEKLYVYKLKKKI